MAIYGIGAFQDGRIDVAPQFVELSAAGTNWSSEDAPVIHHILRRVIVGDLIYIKAFVPQRSELLIKAVGIVIDDRVRRRSQIGDAVGVRWVWVALDEPSRFTRADADDPTFNTRSQTLYEEHDPRIARRVVELLLSAL